MDGDNEFLHRFTVTGSSCSGDFGTGEDFSGIAFEFGKDMSGFLSGRVFMDYLESSLLVWVSKGCGESSPNESFPNGF